MINTYKYNGNTWIDIDHGTPEEIHEIMNTYQIHPLVAKELTSATPKQRVEFHEGYMYCILHFPAFKHTHSKDKNQEVDFIVGKNILITARYDTIDALHKFGKQLEVEEVLGKGADFQSSGFLFVSMLKELYGALFEELEYIEDTTEDITKKIFKGKEKDMVVAISEVTRNLLDFKRVTDFHHEILGAIERHGKNIFDENFVLEAESVIGDYLKINTAIRSNLEILRELRDTNNSLLTSKQNETVKQLTVMGFVAIPLNFIAWLFAMRTEGMPLIHNPNAFWIVLGIMITCSALTMVYVKYKKWL
jgi:magnesium transporter